MEFAAEPMPIAAEAEAMFVDAPEVAKTLFIVAVCGAPVMFRSFETMLATTLALDNEDVLAIGRTDRISEDKKGKAVRREDA